MNDFANSLPELGQLVEQRLAVARKLAESMAASRIALGLNDAEAIARGAAHQAELCRQWSRLEEQLRAHARRRQTLPADSCGGSPDAERSGQLAAEWGVLSARIRYLARVHWSLLRHMQRSLAVWNRVISSGEPTYAPSRKLSEGKLSFGIGE